MRLWHFLGEFLRPSVQRYREGTVSRYVGTGGAADPEGKEIEWRGKPRRVYTMDELTAAALPDWVAHAAVELNQSFGPVLQRWWAN